MSILSYFLLLLLYCISMHACEARNNIGFGHKGFGAPPQHSGKGLFQLVVETLRLGMDSSSKGISVQVKKEDDGTHGGAIILTSQDTKKYSMRTTHHDVKGVMKYSSRSGGRKSGTLAYAGSESTTFESSSHMGLLKATSIKELRRRPRSTRRALSGKEATHYYNKNKVEDADDDVVAIADYTPPHQTPPIHNNKT